LVNDSSQFACVDGPEFDATQVNFEVLMQRNSMYREQEKMSIERLQADPEGELDRLRRKNHKHECAAEPPRQAQNRRSSGTPEAVGVTNE
jgi:flagellar basal body rod protein FlgB